uniref:DUF3810 domain-containing protein n=1 Tax=uncultured Draconibacterium sp. TaxID=1573823 RepID=UPI003216F3A7
MKQITFKKILFQKWLILPTLAVLTFFCTEIASKHPEWIEKYYSQNIYPFIARILSGLSSILPVSLDDLFYCALLLLPLALLILLCLKKISLKYSGKLIVNIAAATYILFYFSWGLNYFRPDLTERLNLEANKANQEEFLEAITKLINRTNHLQCSFENFEPAQTDRLIEKSYENLAPALQIPYPMGTRPDKKITFSGFYAKSGITGYFGPFFNEIHVNKNVLPLEYPFVLAHEKAHQLGITSEAEANFYAWLVCTKSNSQHIQYSANLSILRHFLNQAYKMKEFPELITLINQSVKNDINGIRKHWLLLRNEKMDKVASKVNDTYLKTNKIKGGIEDYRGVVKHVMNFSLDSAFQERYNLATQ